MALSPRIELRQHQALVMTPQLQQAIKLLALSNLEIETFIAEELEKNPLLEAERGDPDAEAPAAPELEPAADRVAVQGGDDRERERLERLDRAGERVRDERLRLFREAHRLRAGADVVARGERRPDRGDEQAAHVRVVGELTGGGRDAVEDLVV